MELKLYRDTYTRNSTIGKLFVNGTFFCFTLEDYCRDFNRDGDLKDAGETKVFGKTCIPSGKYAVVLTVSNRFKKVLPLLLNVQGFEGIRIHNGNTADHTEGCILVGATAATDQVLNSIPTMDRLMVRLKAMVSAGDKIFITIIDKTA